MYEHDSRYHRIHVTDDDGSRILRFEHNHQSSMRLDDPFATDIAYVDYLHIALAVKPDARRALVIGLGGGSVVKRMWRDYPWMRLDVVEIDDEVVAVARELFGVPDDERIRVITGDGRAYVDTTAERYDIVIVDAFDDDHVPRPLLTEEFMREARDLVAPDGVVVWNVLGYLTGPKSRRFRSVHRTASNVWRHIWTFPVGTFEALADCECNIVIVAADADLSEDELLDRIADRVGGRVTVPRFERFGEDLLRSPVRGGDVPLLYDPPTGLRTPKQ
jgi:spermidine synthase